MEQLNKTFMYKGKECNQDKKQTRGEMTKETLKNILAKPEYQTIHDLSLIGIDIFDNEGKFKGAEQITKDISDKINYLINNTCGLSEENIKGDENMINKYENREVQDGRVYLRDIIGNLIKIKESLIYETGYATSKGFTGIINYLKQASLKLDIGICGLKNIDEDFEYKICEINKAIDELSEAVEKTQAANEIYFIRMEVIAIKNKIENEIENLKSFDEMFNKSENIETTEIDSSAEEDKKENEEVKKPTFDETILNENIETMRKEIKEIDSCALSIKPMEKAEIITKLSKEIRKCINVKKHI